MTQDKETSPRGGDVKERSNVPEEVYRFALSAGVDVETEEKNRQPYRFTDAQWLRAQRYAMPSEKNLRDYRKQLATAAFRLELRPGNTVGVAVFMSIAAVVLAIGGVLLGLFIMDIAGDWITSMKES